MDIYNDIIKFISDYLIKGIFISVLLILFGRILFKNKIDTKISINILKWLIVIYTLGAILSLLSIFTLSNSEKYALINRATGPYWISFWLMLITGSFFPFILIYRNLGNKINILLLVTIVMNFGWLFESFIVHITSIHSYNIHSKDGYNPYLPYERELLLMLNAFIFGSLLLILENVGKWRSNNKMNTNLKRF